jgi:hypothetical protein
LEIGSPAVYLPGLSLGIGFSVASIPDIDTQLTFKYAVDLDTANEVGRSEFLYGKDMNIGGEVEHDNK